nr:hypothetical protein Iba_chr13eCG9590 [Ipomoea batatas]
MQRRPPTSTRRPRLRSAGQERERDNLQLLPRLRAGHHCPVSAAATRSPIHSSKTERRAGMGLQKELVCFIYLGSIVKPSIAVVHAATSPRKQKREGRCHHASSDVELEREKRLQPVFTELLAPPPSTAKSHRAATPSCCSLCDGRCRFTNQLRRSAGEEDRRPWPMFVVAAKGKDAENGREGKEVAFLMEMKPTGDHPCELLPASASSFEEEVTREMRE